MSTIESRVRLIWPSAGVAIALIYALAGFRYLTDPSSLSHTPIGRGVAPWSTVWAAFYLSGGLLLAGSRRGRRERLEMIALTMLIGGWAMNFVAFLAVEGIGSGAGSYVILVWWGSGRFAVLQRRLA